MQCRSSVDSVWCRDGPRCVAVLLGDEYSVAPPWIQYGLGIAPVLCFLLLGNERSVAPPLIQLGAGIASVLFLFLFVHGDECSVVAALIQFGTRMVF